VKFKWDENKRQINLRKHGIDFIEAHEIFKNPLLSKIDTRYYGEERWIGLGITHRCVILAVYAEQNEETIRIISIRKATKPERKTYEKYLSNRLDKS